MFPDAPSARALKHLEELADLSGKGFVCHVVFVIMHGSPARFVPNFHTDPAFAAALSRYGTVNPEAEPGKVRIHAALLRSAPDGETVPVSAHIPVDLSFGALAEKNSGNYLFMLELPEARTLEVAALGTVQFEKGWYVYAGSAAKNLDQRIARHLRRVRKKKHWHIDWLTPYAAKCGAFPVRIARSVECDLARSLKAAGGRAIPRFGCSGCLCASSGGSHLYHFAGNPLQNRSFVDMLLRYRHRIALDSSPEP
jgi:sugar fermentation stimulation protein A